MVFVSNAILTTGDVAVRVSVQITVTVTMSLVAVSMNVWMGGGVTNVRVNVGTV